MADDDVWDPGGYLAMVREEIADYETLQAELVAATVPEVVPDGGADPRVRTILELGSGTGETTRRVLDAHAGARLVGVDGSEAMLAVARAALAGRPADFALGRLEDPLPRGPFDLVVSALTVHHLDGPAKADLFARVAAVLRHGGRFVLADVVVPDDPADAVIPLNEGFDVPSTTGEQLAWLHAAGFADVRLAWQRRDLAVLTGLRPRG